MRPEPNRLFAMLPALALLAACSADGEPASDADGGAAGIALDAEASIAESLASSEGLSDLNTAIASAGLTEAMGGVGPYTLFAPADGRAPELESIGEMEMPARAALISYHIVPGLVTSADLRAAVEENGGPVDLATMTGATLRADAGEDGVTITDGAGGSVTVTEADLAQRNGVIHVVDGVLQPG